MRRHGRPDARSRRCAWLALGSSAGKRSGQDGASADRGQGTTEAAALPEALFLPLIAVDQAVVSDRTEDMAPATTPEPPHDKTASAAEEEAVEASFLPLIISK